MRFLVTGGAGFIGSNIVKRLVSEDHSVRVLDNFATGRRENLEDVWDKIDLVEGDIRDFWTVINATKNIDYILHQAALPSVQRSIQNPLTTTEVNVNGTLNMLEAARFHKVKRIVYASSSSTYGNTPTLPKEESMRSQPLSPYAITKLAGEEYCISFYRIYGLEAVCLRYFNVFGPHQNPASQYAAVIPKFIVSFLEDRPPVIFGDGEQSRDFTFIDNVVEANLLACVKDEAVGKVMNVACGKKFSLNDLVTKLQKIAGKKIEAVHQEAQIGDIKHSLASIDLAKKVLGYQVKVDFEKGLEKTFEWFKKKRL
jgi:nucleoside-diphosphate-sugar epimerase